VALAVFSGIIGGLIPALTAARLPIVTALREI
jgi:ABC-type antimicrobial peptide transport system permease subunit